MSEINDLLGIDAKIERPNAYQIFGLEVLESDSARIQTAIKRSVARLKASKDSANAEVWARAAKRVNKARQVLTDSSHKRRYDKRLKQTFESVAIVDSPSAVPVAESAIVGAVSDPLDALLPAGDPFAAFDMDAALEELSTQPEPKAADPVAEIQNPLVETTAEPWPSKVDSPASDNDGFAAAVAGSSAGVDVAKPTKKPYRRKTRIPVAGICMTLFVLGLFGAMGYLVTVLQDQSTQNAGIAAQNEAALKEHKEHQRAPVKRKVHDGVMGGLLPQRSARVPKGRSKIEIGVMPDVIGVKPPRQPVEATPAATSTPPEMATPPPSSPQQVDVASRALDAARAAIRAGAEARMSPLAEKARDAAVTDAQRASGEALVRLVHYAREYQGAIDRSISTLDVGKGWTIREGVVVAVVEVTPRKLVLRVRGTNKEYDRSRLPFTISDALAKQALPSDEALFLTFRAAWQCLRKDATPADRDDAIAVWREAAGKSRGADVTGLAQEVRAIFR